MYKTEYDFILRLVVKAGEMVLRAKEKGFETMIKDGNTKDFVTEVDHEVNEFLIREIKKEFPTHRIYSEEGGEGDALTAVSEYEWVLDPIDGTANFSRDIPNYAVCVGLLKNGIPVVGGIYNPITHELFSFHKGQGAFLNGNPIHVSNIIELKDSHVLLHAGRKEEMREWGARSYGLLLGNVNKTKNLSGAALDAAFVASGRVEANIYGLMKTRDIAAALGLLLEAGGVAVNEKGENLTLSDTPQKMYMANNRITVTNLLALLEQNSYKK